MKYLNRLLTLLLAGCVAFSMMACGNDDEKEKDKGGKAKADTTAVDIQYPDIDVDEADYAGTWVATHGRNTENDQTKDADLGITLTLNEDLTGSYTAGDKSVDLSWYYAILRMDPNDSSIFYIDFECELDEDGGVSFDPFYFCFDTADADTMYLTVGDWLYTCKKG